MNLVQRDPFRRHVENVVVEFDGPTGRERKSFPRESAARSFYKKMSMSGRNPRIVAADLRPQ